MCVRVCREILFCFEKKRKGKQTPRVLENITVPLKVIKVLIHYKTRIERNDKVKRAVFEEDTGRRIA